VPAPSAFDDLRRWPDLETPELQAWDTADAYLLDEAASDIDGSDVVVIGDTHGALTLGALEWGARSVRVHQDAVVGELALAANAEHLGLAGFTSLPLEAALVAGATVVLLRLPRSLEALDEIAALIAAHAAPEVVVYSGGRIKHMTVGMNPVLERHFAQLDVSLARGKSRLLIARDPRPGTASTPREAFLPELDLRVVATGGVFAGARLDIGTRALLEVLDQVPTAGTIIDLGCGTGILAAQAKRSQPTARVIASDQSASAVASARLTMAANGLDVEVVREDALATQRDDSADVILLNPPFHTGAAVHGEVATRLFEEAARVLRPGGELWTVWNSHLQYTPRLRAIVGPTRQAHRTAKFTVTVSTHRSP